MGLMRFVVPPRRIVKAVLDQAFLSGFDRAVQHARFREENGQIVVEKPGDDSVVLSIPWQLPRHGWLVLSTGTLIDQETPYQLPLELARGKLARLSNQLSEWGMLGLEVPAHVHSIVNKAVQTFGRAAVIDQHSAESMQLADNALRLAVDASLLLAGSYCEQLLTIRRRTMPRLQTLLGAQLDGSVLSSVAAAEWFLNAMNSAWVPVHWRDLEPEEGRFCWDRLDAWFAWCGAGGLTVAAGPLFVFDTAHLPPWLTLFEADPEALEQLVCRMVEAVVRRYLGRVDLWICSGRVNSGRMASLTEEHRVRLTAQVVSLVRQLDPDRPAVISLDQPWSEYSQAPAEELPPFQVADALVRSRLGLSGVMLELNLGYYPWGTPVRDPLEFSRQIDMWALLGTPVFLAMSMPSSDQPDPNAARSAEFLPGGTTANWQAVWTARYVPMVIAKPYIYGVFWSQYSDAGPHEFPHGGLIDANMVRKPALKQLANVRQQYLM